MYFPGSPKKLILPSLVPAEACRPQTEASCQNCAVFQPGYQHFPLPGPCVTQMRMPLQSPVHPMFGGVIQPTVSQPQMIQDSKARPNRIKIVNPNTLEEVDYTGDEQKNSTVSKDEQNVTVICKLPDSTTEILKQVPEPSSPIKQSFTIKDNELPKRSKPVLVGKDESTKQKEPDVAGTDRLIEKPVSSKNIRVSQTEPESNITLCSPKKAWKPVKLATDFQNLSPDQKKTQQLYKNVTAILNKLTAQNFQTLIEKFKSLQLNRVDELQTVVDLIFEKAVRESVYCRLYAEVCNVIQRHTVENESNASISFACVLAKKCQQYFECDKMKVLDIGKKYTEIDTCEDPEKKTELNQLLEEVKEKRRRSLAGKGRFIGELVRLQVFSVKIAVQCINQLLTDKSEDSLECLCQLLAIGGEVLDKKLRVSGLNPYFKRIIEVTEQKPDAISSRIYFMVQDVIDLRKRKWVPRPVVDSWRIDDEPAIDFQEDEPDARLENLEPQLPSDEEKKVPRIAGEWEAVCLGTSNEPNTSCEEDIKDTNKSLTQNFGLCDSDLRNRLLLRLGVPGESSATSLNSPGSTDMSRCSSCLNISSAFREEYFLGRQSFSGAFSQVSLTNALRSLYEKYTTEQSSAIVLDSDKKAVENVDISRSYLLQNDNFLFLDQQSFPVPSCSRMSSQATLTGATNILSSVELDREVDGMFDEFVRINNAVQELYSSFQERFVPKQYEEAIISMVLNVIEKNPKQTELCGIFIALLFGKGFIARKEILNALNIVASIAGEMELDLPNVWECLCQILIPLIREECLGINEFKTEFHHSKFFAYIQKKLMWEEYKFEYSENKSNVEREEENEENTRKNFIFNYCQEENEVCNVLGWVQYNMENAKNPSFVFAFTKMICELCNDEIVLQKSAPKLETDEEPLRPVKSLEHLYRQYIGNKTIMDLKALRKMAELKGEIPARVFLGFVDYLDELLQDERTPSKCSEIVKLLLKQTKRA